METMKLEDLKSLADSRSERLVSLFMPTHRHGPETEQDAIVLKNLLGDAAEDLEREGVRSPDVREMLDPALRLLDDRGFWQHQSDGLALFLTAKKCRTYRLPLSFEELVVVSDRFHLKPVLPLFSTDGRFYILALSQNQVRLLEGTRYTVDEIGLEEMPDSIAEALKYETFEQHLQFHTGTSAAPGDRSAMYHGHDEAEQDSSRILRWFHRLDEGLSELLAGKRAPLVLAGVAYLLPLYKEASSYQHLVDKGIPGNPEELRSEELHAAAWPLVDPIFAQARQQTAARYAQLAGTGKTSAQVEEAVLAAHHGRVEALFVAVDTHVWGLCDLGANSVEAHGERQPGDDDLLDLAAVQTLLQGGAVYAVAQADVPGEGPLAAVFRY